MEKWQKDIECKMFHSKAQAALLRGMWGKNGWR